MLTKQMQEYGDTVVEAVRQKVVQELQPHIDRVAQLERDLAEASKRIDTLSQRSSATAKEVAALVRRAVSAG